MINADEPVRAIYLAFSGIHRFRHLVDEGCVEGLFGEIDVGGFYISIPGQNPRFFF